MLVRAGGAVMNNVDTICLAMTLSAHKYRVACPLSTDICQDGELRLHQLEGGGNNQDYTVLTKQRLFVENDCQD